MNILRPALLMLLLVAFSACSVRAADEAGLAFRWQEANSLMLRAENPEDFATAADAYAAMLRDGIVNGPLLYNYSSALLAAGQHAAAARALRRTERYSGTTPEISRSLRLALAGESARVVPSLPWHRPLLFWHHGLPASTRALIAAAAFSAFWLVWALRLLMRRAVAGSVLLTAVATALLFGTSVLASLLGEMRDSRESVPVTMPGATAADTGTAAPGKGGPP